MAIGLGLNAFGQGFSSGANAGARIAASSRAQDVADDYFKRQKEKDAVTAFSTTLGDVYGGDVNNMLNDPMGQQLALDFVMTNPDVSKKMNSNKGWKASALLQGDDGRYKVMMRNDDGEYRPLTVDRKTGTEPVAYSKQDMYAFMAASAAKHGVQNNPQNLQFLNTMMGDDNYKEFTTLLNSGQTPNVPETPSLGAVSSNARAAKKSGTLVPEKVVSGAPVAAAQSVVEEEAPSAAEEGLAENAKKAASGKLPTAEDSPEAFDARTKADIKNLSEQGVNFKDLPDRTKQYLRDEAVQKGVQLRDLDYGLNVDDEDEIAGAAPQEETRPALANDDPKMRFLLGSNYEPEPAQDQAAGATPVADYLRGNAGQGTVPVLGQTGYPASAAAVQQQAGSQGNTDFLGRALDFAKNNNIIGTYMGGVDRDAPAATQVGQVIRNAPSNLAEAANPIIGLARNAYEEYGEGIREVGSQFAAGLMGTEPQQNAEEQTAKREESPSDNAVGRTLKNEAVREADATHPTRSLNIRQGINETLRTETPQERVAKDESMVNLLQKTTKKPTARQRYAAMRLAQSGVLTQGQMANYFENGRLAGSDLQDMLAVMKQRNDAVKANAAATKARTSAVSTVQKLSKDQREQLDNTVENLANNIAPVISNNKGLMEALQGSKKFGGDTGVSPVDYIKSNLELELQNPETVLALSRGRTTDPTQLDPVEVRQLADLLRTNISRWTRGNRGGFFTEGSPENTARMGDFNIREMIRAAQ